MATFKPNVPVVQAGATVTVDVTPAAPISVGAHTFRLVVVDDAGNESAPVTIQVVVKDTDKPTAVLEMIDKGTGVPLPQPYTVAPGISFTLSAAKSSDASSKIKEYRFTLDPV